MSVPSRPDPQSRSRSVRCGRRPVPLFAAAVLAFLLLGLPAVPASWQTLFQEDFSADPVTSGPWRVQGLNSVNVRPAQPPLIRWDAAARNLRVRWDSARADSLFGLPLGRTVTERDDFAFAFTVRVDAIANPTGDYFEIAVGLDDSLATRTRVFDRSGKDFFDPADPRRCRNIVEWNWIPPYQTWGGGDDSYVASTVCPEPGDIFRNHFGMVGSATALRIGRSYRVRQVYRAATRTLSLTMLDNGTTVTTEDVTTPVVLSPDDTFTVDRFGVKSYRNRYALGEWTVEGAVDDMELEVNGEVLAREDFKTDPAGRSWAYAGLRSYGQPDPALAAHDPAAGRLDFTWDALAPCTAFDRPLPHPVTDRDSFAFEFDLELAEIQVNGDYFEIAVGLHRAGDHLFDRGGKNFFDPSDPTRCKNIVDWSWVPPFDVWGGGQASYVASTLAPDPGPGGDVILNHAGNVFSTTELTTGVLYHVRQEYRADTRQLTLQMAAAGVPIRTDDVEYAVQLPPDAHFEVDRFGPVSYFNSWAFVPGDWRVRGTLDNLVFQLDQRPAAGAAGWERYE